VVRFPIFAVGLVIIVHAGTAVMLLPLGLGVLGTEFVWAKRLLKKLRAKGEKVASSVVGKPNHKDDDSNSKDAA
jgi:urea transporter